MSKNKSHCLVEVVQVQLRNRGHIDLISGLLIRGYPHWSLKWETLETDEGAHLVLEETHGKWVAPGKVSLK